MDGFNEKKWFVYLGDHHEGPFSLAEMQTKMNARQVTLTHYVWCEGMSDWLPMTEVPQLQPLAQSRPTSAPASAFSPALVATSPTPETSRNGDAPALEISTAMEEASQVRIARDNAVKAESPSIIIQSADEVSRPIILSAVSQSNPAVTGVNSLGLSSNAGLAGLSKGGGIPQKPAQFQADKSPSKLKGWFLKGVAILILGTLGGLMINAGVFSGDFDASRVKESTEPMLISLTETFPALSSWISPIPAISDITPEAYEELRLAAAQPLSSQGPSVALAHSQSGLEAPVFYIATNLPDGVRFDLTIDGVPGTLLGQLSVNLKVQAVAQKRWVKTDPLRFADGRPIPRGQYKVKISEASSQVEPVQVALAGVPAKPGATHKLEQTRQLFLGGARDAVYASRLKEYVDELKKRAQTELAEVEQFTTTLESQLNSTVASFAAVRKKLTAPKTLGAGRKDWSGAHAGWQNLMAKLNESFAKWNPASLSTDFYYGSLYAELLKVSGAIEKVHQLHDGFVSGQNKDPAFETQLNQSVGAAQTMVSDLKNRITKIKSAPPSPNGVPQREGT
jgi:hypothetical protein